MPDTYSSQYREMVLARVRAGRSICDPAEGPEVSAATIFRRKKQDQIDAGPAVGLSSKDGAERRAARTRIAELEKGRVTPPVLRCLTRVLYVGPRAADPLISSGYRQREICSYANDGVGAE